MKADRDWLIFMTGNAYGNETVGWYSSAAEAKAAMAALREAEAAKAADDESWYNPPPPVGGVEESVREDARWERDEPEDDYGA